MTCVLLLFLFVGLLSYSLWDRAGMEGMLVHGYYYIMLLLVTTWGFTLWHHLRQIHFVPFVFLNKYWPGLAGALLLSILVFVTIQHEFRVLTDETNLLAVSRSLAFSKTIDNATMGKWYYNQFYNLHVDLPKRPVGFPFLTHLLHVVLGYHPENVFILNFIFLYALLAMVAIGATVLWNRTAGAAAMFLVISQPIITLSATSGGFDFCAMVFFALMLVSVYRYTEKPSPHGLILLWFHLLIFAQIRYESFVFLFLLPLFLGITQQFHWQHVKAYLHFYALTPVLMLPTVWQRLLSQGKFVETGEESNFSLSHFFENSVEFVQAQGRFDFYLPYATVLNLFSLVTLALFPLALLFKKRFGTPFQSQFVWFAAGVVLLNSVVFLSHHFGFYTHPASARFFLVITLFLSLVPFLHHHFFPEMPAKWFLLASLILFVLYHPVAMENRFNHTLTLTREYRTTLAYLKQHFPNSNILIIADRPGMYTPHHWGAVDFPHARENATGLKNELNRRLFQDIVAIQHMKYETDKPIGNHQLKHQYDLEILYESQNEANEYIRISRVLLPEVGAINPDTLEFDL